MNPKVSSRTGFTIAELLIVIVVIGILAAITVVAYNGIRARADDASRAALASKIQKALENFATINDRYPTQAEVPSSVPDIPAADALRVEGGYSDSSTKGVRYIATQLPNGSGFSCGSAGQICRYYRLSYWSTSKNVEMVLENSR